ncbi:MAG: hypothetical protein JWP44_3025 [Mucilaginibacter sp.]|nr:hypothetical protein [Mucilaginibacter sp.]
MSLLLFVIFCYFFYNTHIGCYYTAYFYCDYLYPAKLINQN